MSASSRCDGCAVDLLPDSSFCHACGKALDGGARGLTAQGERKPITVLFVDAFGSIDLGDRLDAEQWHDVVESFFSVVSLGVRQFGGTIDRLTGSGIKVLFGAPAALESHANQACHAALHIASRLREFRAQFKTHAGMEFSARMGLNSGEVVFGPVGVAAEHTFTSQGHTAAIAARMQQMASPGQICVSEHTASLVADFFELREMGSLPVRNASTAVRVFELLGAREHRSRFDAARERGLSPFIGRTLEIAELEQALDAASTGSRRVVGIVGEPGVGKSRLGEEFAELQRSRGLMVHHTRCVEHGRWIPFHATLPILRELLGIAVGERSTATRDKIKSGLLAADPALADTLPTVLSVLGVSQPGEALTTSARAPSHDLTRVVRRLIEQRDARRPSIFVVDDQQWMDAGSDAIFTELVQDPPRSSVLVLVTYRRGHQRRWMSDPDFTELSLRPLDRRATLELVRALVGSDRSLGTLPKRIAERAAGNPFFVEEIVLSFVESNALDGRPGAYRLRHEDAPVAVPGSLHAVLAARVDQLGKREKPVLQAASVIGREFSASLLAAIAGHDLDELVPLLRSLEAADFVSGTNRGDEAAYTFRHPLLRETVYRSLLRERRIQLHRAIIRELQRVHGSRCDAHAAQLALHAEAAGDDLDAARWHRRAARNAVRWAPVQGLEHWRRVLTCTGRQTEGEEASRLRLSACEAIVRLGFHQGLTPEGAGVLIREGEQIARRLGDKRATALLVSAAGGLCGAAGDVGGAIERNAHAFALAEESHDAELALMFGARLVLSQRIAGQLRDALPRAEAILATHGSARITTPTPGLVALRQMELARTVVLLDRGELRRGGEQLQQTITALRSENAPMVLAWALSLSATLIRHSGDDAPLLVARVEEARALAQRLGIPSLLARAITSLAVTRLCQERWDEARILAEEATETLHDVGHTFYVDVNPAIVLAYAHLGLGDAPRARGFASDALELALGRGSRLGQIDALLGYGRILLRRGSSAEREQARRLLRHGLVLVRETRARSREPLFWLELASDARRSGDQARGRAYRERAVRQLVAMDARGHVRHRGLDAAPADFAAQAPPARVRLAER